MKFLKVKASDYLSAHNAMLCTEYTLITILLLSPLLYPLPHLDVQFFQEKNPRLIHFKALAV